MLLIPYAFVVGIFLLYALFNVYHLVYYGATSRVSFVFTFTFLAGAVIIMAVSWWVLKDYNWAQTVVFAPFGGGVAAHAGNLNVGF